MQREEAQIVIRQAVRQIEDTTTNIIRAVEINNNWQEFISVSANMRANEDAQIYEHLIRAIEPILEPNTFVTVNDSQGHKKTIVIGRYKLEVTVVHRAIKIEDIYGVDVFYHFNNLKALAFQHKKRDKNGTIAFSNKDKEQREKIMNLCGGCTASSRKKNNKGFIKPFCGSAYIMGGNNSSARHVISACQIEEYRREYGANLFPVTDNFPLPSNLETVDYMFMQCNIGWNLRNRKEELYAQSTEDAFLSLPDIVLRANLSIG